VQIELKKRFAFLLMFYYFNGHEFEMYVL